ncbi:hypothetical protein LTR56_007667 [Elasticomyces elasticus]|nr:hypothetical protein LTR56_007667 [Elasticomyces elasticus]KAK3665367.1 hypothetical protein LTR22_003890 [Elasticomyces elasticus]KAK4929659.1 hypothetical protein LTR49_003616 [Elasticomyces elasticus]KAK5761120.1 hypothetical protein LTS12_008798 [Elasticomyces elasticus]
MNHGQGTDATELGEDGLVTVSPTIDVEFGVPHAKFMSKSVFMRFVLEVRHGNLAMVLYPTGDLVYNGETKTRGDAVILEDNSLIQPDEDFHLIAASLSLAIRSPTSSQSAQQAEAMKAADEAAARAGATTAKAPAYVGGWSRDNPVSYRTDEFTATSNSNKRNLAAVKLLRNKTPLQKTQRLQDKR